MSRARPRTRLRAWAAIATCVALGALAAAPGGSAVKAEKPAVARCALGKLSPALRKAVPRGLVREQRRYERSLSGLGASDRKRAGKAFATGAAAYLYGMPAVLFRRTVETFPRNTMVGIAELATPQTRTVVAPNHDTLYTVSQLDLTDGPLVIDAPATEGRYSVMQLLDAFTNSFGYVGSGRERDAATAAAVTPPGWQGTLPPGVRELRSPTDLVWLLGRTLVDGPDDRAAAKALVQQYALTPLAKWTAGERAPAVVLDEFPGSRPPVVLPEGLEFFDELGLALAAGPPPQGDGCALAAFARFGIGPGLKPSEIGDPLVAEALDAAARAGDRLTARAVEAHRRRTRKRNHNWTATAPNTGRFGTDYSYRAIVARMGLGANVREEAYYPNTDRDSRGRRLKGRHRYVIEFKPGQLPPVRAFWSLTMYDRDLFLVENPIDRYAIGDRTDGLRYGRDGSLRIYVQHESPAKNRRSNWLPAPRGRFELYLRLYEPKRRAFKGWKPPAVRRLK